MLITTFRAAVPPRLTVFAYDVASPKRARRLRKLLHALRHANQYSVHEVLLDTRAFSGVLAELTECCKLEEDRLAVWWPRGGLRLEWRNAKLCSVLPGGSPAVRLRAAGAGNYVVCYDISDPHALMAVAAQIAAHGLMVQRSVYWLRMPQSEMEKVVAKCAPHVSQNDCLWAYPLRSARDLWIVGEQHGSLLPVAADRWGRTAR